MISVDVGSVNLGVALFDETHRLVDIQHLNCTTVKRATVARSCSDLQKRFSRFLSELEFTPLLGLIEQQPRRNMKTKVLSHCIQVMLLQAGIKKIRFISPKLKLGLPHKTTYYQRKKMAVKRAADFLRKGKYEALLKTFSNLKKKDDVADAILQAVAVLPAPLPAPKQSVDAKSLDGVDDKQIVAKTLDVSTGCTDTN